MRYRTWMAVLAAFLLLGFLMDLSDGGWGLYTMAVIYLWVLMTQPAVWDKSDEDDDGFYEGYGDQTHYPAGSRELQMASYHDDEGLHPDHYKNSPLY